MDFFKLNSGLIISYNQEDNFKYDGKTVDVIPASEFLFRF